ncbi:endothelial cell-specific molecule 1, partial [Lethenteron reissneri]|uniref:endothelial cell-specific molecule 1 n=1 Tax=Lethenteron reissneri TaxID=7753 RepID=UPI002AB7D90A
LTRPECRLPTPAKSHSSSSNNNTTSSSSSKKKKNNNSKCRTSHWSPSSGRATRLTARAAKPSRAPRLPARRWCRRAVPDDCGCCSVCAAGRGERCYPAVVGLNWLKCAKGLRCRPAGEDEFGDTYGLCEDCPAGTYGLGCSGVCNCLSGRCEPESGKCHRLPFVQNAARTPPKKRLAASHTNYRWHRTG